jgi:acetoin utilization protein AcuB
MSVEALMSRQPVTVELDDTLRTVREIFSHAKFHHLLVVEEGRLYGVLSDRDLLKAISPRIATASETEKDRATLNKKVHQIMTRNPVVVKPQDSVYDAIDLINKHGVSCLPVVDAENRPVGVLSWRDIFRALGAKRVE